LPGRGSRRATGEQIAVAGPDAQTFDEPDALLDPICGNWPLERVPAALRVSALTKAT
jgi:hypothetical protein